MSRVLRYVVLVASTKVPKTLFRDIRRSICTKHLYEAKAQFLENKIALLKSPTAEKQCIRNKYTRKKKRQEEESDSDDEDSEDESINEIKDKSSKIVKVNVNSLRADLMVKVGLGISRNKVEDLFYASKLRVNGKKIPKKSIQLHVNDEVDVIRGVSPMNPDFLVISRVKVLSATGAGDHIIVKVERIKSLMVENYEEPWKDAESS